MTQAAVRVVPAPQEAQPARRIEPTEIMIIARKMADEMSTHMEKVNDTFRLDPANRERLELLATDPARRILQERLRRLLDRDEWDRPDVLDLSALFFLLATDTTEQP